MMHAFRRPPPGLSIVVASSSLSRWVPLLSNLTRLSRQMSSLDPKPSEDTGQRTPNSTVDPFGLDEVIKSSDKSSVLVQGFYTDQTQSSEPSPIPKAPQVVSTPRKEAIEDPDKQSRLSLYDSWLKQRTGEDVAGRNYVESPESLRQAHFGRIRMDSDNPVQFRTSRPSSGEKIVPKQPRPQRNAAKSSDLENEEITETIEADHSVRMRASDFLKKLRTDKEQEEDLQVSPREKTVIQRIIRPAHVSSLDSTAPENMAATVEQALNMDSNTVPKEYLLPDLNQITKEDMWNVLKKSIIFHNDFILAINKPPGVPVHSKARSCRHTVIQFLEKFAEYAKVDQIYPLHRIDKETTGVLLMAKDPKIAKILKDKFANRQIDKTYLGVTKLCPKVREGSIKIPIGEGKIPGTSKYRRVLRPDLREFGVKATNRDCVEGVTNYKVLSSIQHASFVEVKPISGAKHQIRVHFGMGLGCPIIGDHKYSHRDRLAPQRLHPYVLHKIKVKQTKVRDLPLHLHCSQISFTLPEEFTNSTEPVHVQAKMPFYMRYTLKRLNLIR